MGNFEGYEKALARAAGARSVPGQPPVSPDRHAVSALGSRLFTGAARGAHGGNTRRAIFVLFASFTTAALAETTPMSLSLTSSDFEHQGSIPSLLTCEGEDLSPSLSWSGAPSGTKSFVLIIDDPDAPDPKHPKMTWVHWVLYNLPANTASLPQGVKTLPPGTREGLNDSKRTAYGGPCPPIGRHRYFHKLYALDTVLPDLRKPTKAALEKAMEGHVLAKAELVGTYEKGR